MSQFNSLLEPNRLHICSSLTLMLASHCPEVDTRRWNFEFRAKLVLNFDISQSTAEVITMPTEGHTIALEHNTKVPRRYYEGNIEL